MSVSLKTSFYATFTTLITTTKVATRPQKEKPAVCSKPKNIFSTLTLTITKTITITKTLSLLYFTPFTLLFALPFD
jgi:hypothetical protein